MNVPLWFFALAGRELYFTADRSWWATNSHVCLRLSGRRRPSACRVRLATRKLGEVVRLVTSIPRARFAPSAPLPMPPSPWAADARTRFVKLGGSAINARYAALVERLYPGCSWRVPPNRLDPVRAVVAGKVVALVMPLNVWPRRPVKAVRA